MYLPFSELIQTELHHMRTLHIMERVFRQGMLEELQLEPSTVHAMFPCLDQLIRIHSHFLAQLLLRRKNSLHPGSSRNFTIHQLGDILLEQVTALSDWHYTGMKIFFFNAFVSHSNFHKLKFCSSVHIKS